MFNILNYMGGSKCRNYRSNIRLWVKMFMGNKYKPWSENVTKTYFIGTKFESLASFNVFLVAVLTFAMSSLMEPVTSMTKVSDVFTISSLEWIPNISRKTSGPNNFRSPLSKFKINLTFESLKLPCLHVLSQAGSIARGVHFKIISIEIWIYFSVFTTIY